MWAVENYYYSEWTKYSVLTQYLKFSLHIYFLSYVIHWYKPNISITPNINLTGKVIYICGVYWKCVELKIFTNKWAPNIYMILMVVGLAPNICFI